MASISFLKSILSVSLISLAAASADAQSARILHRTTALQNELQSSISVSVVSTFFFDPDTLNDASCNDSGHDQQLHGCDTITIKCGDPSDPGTPRRGACVLGECEIILPQSTCDNLKLPAGDYPTETLRDLIDSFPYRNLIDVLNACSLSHEIQHTTQDPNTTSDCQRENEGYLNEATCLLRRANENCFGSGTGLSPEVCKGVQLASCMRQGAATFHACRCDNGIGETSDPADCPAECRQRCESTVAACMSSLDITPGMIDILKEHACGQQTAQYCLAVE